MKNLLTIMTIATMLASCFDDTSCSPETRDDDLICITTLMAEIKPDPRVSDDGNAAPTWSANDSIGLFCAQSTPNASNLKCTYSSPNWSMASVIYWANSTTAHKFYAYSPYVKNNSAAGSIALPVLNSQSGTLTTSQNVLYSNNLNSGITKSTNSGTAPLTFKHALTLIQLNITADNSMPANTQLSTATITGQVADVLSLSAAGATLDLTTGTITPNSSGSNTVTVTPASSPILSTTPTILNILILPGSSTPSLTISCNYAAGGGSGTATVNMGNQSFVQNTKYTYTVTVSMGAIIITGLTISPWTSSGPATPINPIL